ncbi:TRAP transporter small permease [Jiella sonneratiae]|uniref:TRAP transporter small permease protein n=1 Tax=Jiella sonneratiae TaxID=2816856 RepID=A0ABS3J207_9HYPH|nr:TRAP transporter small permease [Jiella sonneratiae]MBO0903721.1 TRAP transporter small permease [Jiella sonneratiae]
MSKVLHLVYLMNALLVGLCLAVMLAIILYLVACRLFGWPSVFWGEELARYLMFHMVMLGSALALRHQQHPRITILTDLLPEAIRRRLPFVVDALLLATLCILFYQGLEMAEEEGMFTTPALRWSFFWVYLAVPLGAAAAALQIVCGWFFPRPLLLEDAPDESAF